MTDQLVTVDQSTTLVPSKKRKRNGTSTGGPRKPRQKPVECPVCLTARSPALILVPLACNCIYCVPCIREVFSISLQSENGISNYPARCCGRVLDHILLEDSLTPQLRRAYNSKVEEMASNDPLYCGNPECGAFILESSIKDDFGSCGKCKMKTCVKKECNKTRAEHLGVYVICPGELETEELRILAEEKGWKRCPKCYVLTERTRGCDDVRCYCRTEWCYKCGKAMKGTKDVCLCYPTRILPPVQPAQNVLQIQRETIVIQDEDDHDINVVDVRPSIEEIERDSTSIFNTESDLIAELTRHANLNLADQNGARGFIIQPEAFPSENDTDIMEELDALAAPNTRETRGLLRHTSETSAANTEGQSSTTTWGTPADGLTDSLEDMLHTFNSYEALSSSTPVAIPTNDPDNPTVDSLNHVTESASLSDSEPVSTLFFGVDLDSTRHNNIAFNQASEPPHYAHIPPSGGRPNASTLTSPNHQSAHTTTLTEPNITTTDEPDSDLKTSRAPPDIKSDTRPTSSPHPSPAQPDMITDSLPETTLAEKDTAMELNDDWLMDSIEEYLGTQVNNST